MTHVRLSRAASDLWEQEVDTKWRALIFEVLFDLTNVLGEHFGCLAQAAYNTDTSCKACYRSIGNVRTCEGAYQSW